MKGSDRLKEKIFRVLKIVTAVLACVSALLLIASAAWIWLSRGAFSAPDGLQEDVYTREVIAQSFGAIAPVIWAFLASVAVTGIFSLFCPQKKSFPKPQRADKPSPAGKSGAVLRWAVLALSVLLIVLGIGNGGMKDVLIKAIKICTECVGLG